MAFLWFISTVNRGKCQPGKGRRSKGILQVLEVEPSVHFPSNWPSFPLAPGSAASSTRRDALPFQRCCRNKRDLGESNLDPEDGSGMALRPLQAAPGD